MVQIREAMGEGDFRAATELLLEYAASLNFDLCFQDFQHELASLSKVYARPGGCLLLAEVAGGLHGCVAMRPLSESVCEMKRLYVRPAVRGQGIGRVLAVTVVGRAQERGYSQMRLDTLASMVEAIGLYESMGFREIGPYRHNPIEGARFFEVDLQKGGQGGAE